MDTTLFVVGIVCAVLGGGFLIASVAMFFGFHIPALRRDVSGALERKQIEEIRKKSGEVGKRKKVNVFEELEKNAKIPTKKTIAASVGTTVLNKGAKPVDTDFIIEKDIMYVSTNEVML